MRKIKNFLCENNNVLVACEYTNTGICNVYLTNSGKVTRKEFGYIEDCYFEIGDIMENGEKYNTLSLPIRNFKRIEKLQNILIKLF